MTRVKICGMMDRDDLGIALEAGVDAVGFVVDIPRSRHNLSPEKVRDLGREVPPFTQRVAVIEPETLSEAICLARTTGCDVVQVQGSLSARDIYALREATGRPVVAAIAAGSCTGYEMQGCADAILVDSAGERGLGGTGRIHDWNETAKIAAGIRMPLILAGGLRPENVAQAVQMVRPYAVDVSSGVETAGRKDPGKVMEFVRQVRSCL